MITKQAYFYPSSKPLTPMVAEGVAEGLISLQQGLASASLPAVVKDRAAISKCVLATGEHRHVLRLEVTRLELAPDIEAALALFRKTYAANCADVIEKLGKNKFHRYIACRRSDAVAAVLTLLPPRVHKPIQRIKLKRSRPLPLEAFQKVAPSRPLPSQQRWMNAASAARKPSA